MARRDDSIVPLSREHHYALMLCLRIRRGLNEFHSHAQWLARAASYVGEFFQADLLPHFAAEEEVLFPSLKGSAEWDARVAELLMEHRTLRDRVQAIAAAEAAHRAERLAELADLLESHIRKEENHLFPLYEKLAGADVRREVGQAIRDRTGDAMAPRRPEIINQPWNI